MPNVAPMSAPAAADPETSAQANATHVSDDSTIVANPRPSWAPKPIPYTQPR